MRVPEAQSCTFGRSVTILVRLVDSLSNVLVQRSGRVRTVLKPSSQSKIYRSSGWRVALAMFVCLLYAGFVRAAHVHKSEANGEHSQHLECLLCMDANHLAVPTALAQAPVFQLAWFIIVVPLILGASPRVTSLFYDARGPPRV
jgi:hypothetical protein